MGLYDRDYMRGSESTQSIPRVVLVLGVVVSLITASSYLMKELRLFSKATAKTVSHEPSDHEKLLAISPIDLNTATLADLDHLPYVTEAIAADIIAARPFQSIDQLDDITGIGEKKLKRIRQYVEEIPIINERGAKSSETQPAKTEDGD